MRGSYVSSGRHFHIRRQPIRDLISGGRGVGTRSEHGVACPAKAGNRTIPCPVGTDYRYLDWRSVYGIGYINIISGIGSLPSRQEEGIFCGSLVAFYFGRSLSMDLPWLRLGDD